MCKTKSGFFTNRQGISLFYEQCLPAGAPPRAIVQIAHGMRESTGYYAEFCRALSHAGYGAFVHDARGHGRTAGAPGSPQWRAAAGDIGPDGFTGLVDDLAEITDFLRSSYPDVPVVLLGHSMGSVVARLYASRYGQKIAALLYSGTTGPADPQESLAFLTAAQEEASQKGRQAVAETAPQLLFGHFNERFAPVVTGYEYMSRDAEMVHDAISSPFAAVPYRCGFFVDFITAIRQMDLPEAVGRIPKELPIYSFSGDMDPFGAYGEGIKVLFERYRRHGLQNASFILYPGGRHEMLRETNRREVFADIIRWLDMLAFAPAGSRPHYKIAYGGAKTPTASKGDPVA